MKNIIILLFILFMIISCSQKTEPPKSPQGEKVKAPDGLYEFTLTGAWKERDNPGDKIEKMFMTPDNLGRFFVLRIPGAPHEEIKEGQLSAYIEGLKKRYDDFHVLLKKVDSKYGTSVGIVVFTYNENTPQGPLKIRNYCEVMVHKNNYMNVCGASPASVWENKREKILKIFPTWKLL